ANITRNNRIHQSAVNIWNGLAKRSLNNNVKRSARRSSWTAIIRNRIWNVNRTLKTSLSSERERTVLVQHQRTSLLGHISRIRNIKRAMVHNLLPISLNVRVVVKHIVDHRSRANRSIIIILGMRRVHRTQWKNINRPDSSRTNLRSATNTLANLVNNLVSTSNRTGNIRQYARSRINRSRT